jgi:hypothetical protein
MPPAIRPSTGGEAMHAGSRGQVQPADDDVASGRSEQEGVQRSLPGHEATGRSSGSRGFRARPPPGTPPLLAHATTARAYSCIHHRLSARACRKVDDDALPARLRGRHPSCCAVGPKVSIRRPAACTTSASASPTAAKGILAVTDTSSVTVIELRTGEVLSVHDNDPARDYWRNKQRSPGRWPGLPVT